MVNNILNNMNNDDKNVLLAEDYEINAEIAKELIESFGVNVTIAENGETVCSISQSAKFDMILMDINMPFLDGIQATGIIRKDSSNPNQNTPIIGLTAHLDDTIIKECKKLGMNDVQKKPIRLAEIELLFEQWFGFESETEKDKAKKTNQTPMNWQEALYEFSNKKEMLLMVLDRFISITDEQITQLKDFITKDNLLEARKIVHKIKGASLNLCATKLGEIAGKIEDFCIDEKPTEIKIALPELETKYDNLKKYIDRIKNENSDN